MGHRFYDPSSGRFLNRDPAGVGNLYAFADGNPEDLSDPTGFAPWRFSLTVGGFCFDNDTVFGGAWVGVNAVAAAASMGAYNGGVSRCDPAFGISYGLADAGVNTLLAVGTGGAGEIAEGAEGGEILEEAAEGLTCPCFVAGTMVEMADGTHKPIQDVHLGEQVMSRDPITGEVKAEPVAQVFTHPASNLVTVTLSDGETLTCTPTHPFYVSGKGFVPAGELTAGEKLVSGAEAQGDAGAKAVTVSRVAWQKETAGTGATGTQTLVYNLGVASTHTYFVGNENDGVWVHNACNETPQQMGNMAHAEFPEYIQSQYPYSDFHFPEPNAHGPDAVLNRGNLFDPEWDFAELKPDNAQGYGDAEDQITERLESGGYGSSGKAYFWRPTSNNGFSFRPGNLYPNPDQATFSF